MGFKYKKFEVRTGEVVEPTRVRENMQTLAHEINGNLDRENLPEKCIDSDSIALETFNDIRHLWVVIQTSGTSSTSNTDKMFTMQNAGNQFVEFMSTTIDVPVDCVVVAHFGAYWEWVGVSSEMDLLDADGSSSSNWTTLDGFDDNDYGNVQEHFADFRLRINGEDVCKTFSYPFIRKKQGGYMTGALQVSAGQIKISVEVKQFRNDLGTLEASKAFYFKIKDRQLLVQGKKR
tara:strand:- start:429 stop:1127 length:699 start_codon:yes stop_codon:yes gene_type:complete